MNKLKSYAASRRGRDTLLSFGIVIAAFIIVQALIAGGMISSQIKGLLVPICAYVVMAISLNMTVGILGELSLGHAGFMSVGAFAGIVTTTCLADAIPLAPLRLAVAMIVGAAFAHNFALAGNPDALNDAKELVVGGIGTNGKIAVAVGFVVLLAISLINSRQKEVQA